MLDALLDALGYVGSSLDKAGPRPLRGLLAGKPREALSFVPFSDRMGITDPTEVTTGRDLTNKWGVTDPSDQGWGAWATGVGTEAVLDPLALFGAAKAGVKGLSGLSRAMKPSVVNPVHHLAGLLGDSQAATRAATHLSPMESALWEHANRRGSLRTDYLSALKDEGTPVGRLKGLGDAAGVKVFPEPGVETTSFSRYQPARAIHEDTPFEDFLSQATNKNAIAHYDTARRMVVPNVLSQPELWFDNAKAAEHAALNYAKNWYSTPFSEHIPVHEIGHGLHQDKLVKLRLLKPNDWTDLRDILAGVDPHAYDWTQGTGLTDLVSGLSNYSRAEPTEFVAEAFAKLMTDLASGRTSTAAQSFNPRIWDLYHRRLFGPEVTPGLLEKLRGYLG